MDMRNILDKIKQIESRQNLMEDSQPSQPVRQNTQQVVSKNTARPNSIFSTLVREFGYDITEAPAQPAQRNLFQKIGDFHKQNTANLAAQQQAEADMAKPENIAAFKASLTPSQLKWADGVDLSDPIIRSRIPKPQPGEKPAGATAAPAGTPVGGVDDEGNIMPGFTQDEQGNVVRTDPNFVEPATQKLAQQGRQAAKEKEFAASADQADADMGAAMKANAQAAKEKEYAANADAEDQAMGQAMAANAAGGPSSVNAQGQNVTMPGGTNPETGEKTQTATAAAPAAAAGGAGKPAASKSDPKVKALQDKLIAAGAKIKADGIMGPQTAAAMKQFPKAVGGQQALPQGVAPSTAGSGRGGQGGPTAAQLATARAPAAPAAPDPVKDPAGYTKYMNDRLMRAQQQKAGGAAKPAPAALPGKAVPGAGNIGDNPMPESRELDRIKSLISYRW